MNLSILMSNNIVQNDWKVDMKYAFSTSFRVSYMYILKYIFSIFIVCLFNS